MQSSIGTFGHGSVAEITSDVNRLAAEIIQGAAQGIIIYDTELRYRLFNPYMQTLTGKSEAEVLGKCALEVFPALKAYGFGELMQRALHGEVVHAHDVLVPGHGQNSRDVWESCVFAPHCDAEGKIVGVIGMVHEVTERHLSEERFRNIVVGTASVVGIDFFSSLVRHTATALRVRYAFLTDWADREHARMLAFWNGNEFGENFEIELCDTPCSKVLQGEVCHYSDSLRQLFPRNKYLAEWGAESYLGVPMFDLENRVIGHIAILDVKRMEPDPNAIDIVRIFAARAAAEINRQKAEEELKAALRQVQALRRQLEAENIYLQEEIRSEHNFDEIVGNSPALVELLNKVERIAATDTTVLIHGETGTGKELIARALHSRSRRKTRPLVKINCGAIPTGLVESELFGHVKGAFTGALERRIGRFELADGGTLFLDEVGELSLETQVKLLRVLQEQEFEPVGSGRTVHVDVRIIAASNRDLNEEVRSGRFRSDLFYRLNVLPLMVPPLRDRSSDIPTLVQFFVERFAKKCGKEIRGVSQQTMALLLRYPWPGNIRELQNVIERGVALSQGSLLQFGPDLLPIERPKLDGVDTSGSDLWDGSDTQSGNGSGSLKDFERRHILMALDKTAGVIHGPRGAARVLALHPNTLRSRMKKLGIPLPSDRR